MPSFPKRASARPGMTRESSVHPILGPIPGLPGHCHSGIMLASLTGMLRKKMLLQQPTTRAVAPYHVARLTVFP